jgi:hypothetical protein
MFPQPHYLPCSECGVSIPAAEAEQHVCDESRKLDFELVKLRGLIDAFETEFAQYLDTARGRFETWIAERGRSGS